MKWGVGVEGGWKQVVWDWLHAIVRLVDRSAVSTPPPKLGLCPDSRAPWTQGSEGGLPLLRRLAAGKVDEEGGLLSRQKTAAVALTHVQPPTAPCFLFLGKARPGAAVHWGGTGRLEEKCCCHWHTPITHMAKIAASANSEGGVQGPGFKS